MKDLFPLFLELVLAAEGGFVNDPDDRGGATNFGITVEMFRTYINDVEDRDYPCGLEEAQERLVSISIEDVRSIYMMYYWEEVQADSLPPYINVMVADWAVNSGPQRAIIGLQRVVGASPDGIIGPETRAKVQAKINNGEGRFLHELYIARLRSYYDISGLKNNEKFLAGWNNRVTKLYNALYTQQKAMINERIN